MLSKSLGKRHALMTFRETLEKISPKVTQKKQTKKKPMVVLRGRVRPFENDFISYWSYRGRFGLYVFKWLIYHLACIRRRDTFECKGHNPETPPVVRTKKYMHMIS